MTLTLGQLLLAGLFGLWALAVLAVVAVSIVDAVKYQAGVQPVDAGLSTHNPHAHQNVAANDGCTPPNPR